MAPKKIVKKQPKKDTRLPFYVTVYDDEEHEIFSETVMAHSRKEALQFELGRIADLCKDEEIGSVEVEAPRSMSDADIMLQQKAEKEKHQKIEKILDAIYNPKGAISEAALDAGGLWVWSLWIEEQALTIISPLQDVEAARSYACEVIAKEFVNKNLSPEQLRLAIQDVLDYDPISLPLKDATAFLLVTPK